MAINTGSLITEYGTGPRNPSSVGQQPLMIFDGQRTENPSSRVVHITDKLWVMINVVAIPDNVNILISRIDSADGTTVNPTACSGVSPTTVDMFAPMVSDMYLGGQLWQVNSNIRQTVLAIPGTYVFHARSAGLMLDDTTDIVVRYSTLQPFQFPSTYFAGIK